MTNNNRTFLPIPAELEGIVDNLPACERNADGTCIFCGDNTRDHGYATYTLYLLGYENLYEGRILSGPWNPASEEVFDWYANSCLK